MSKVEAKRQLFHKKVNTLPSYPREASIFVFMFIHISDT